MENTRLKVLIADDERTILEGLAQIIDWDALGCDIIATADNGQETLKKLLSLLPDLVLLDIRMPGYDGMQIMEKANAAGFRGKFIILSAYSDFKFAQAAMRYGVDFYLTKPIDEEELEDAVRQLANTLKTEQRTESSLRQYREIARDSILHDILTDCCDYQKLDLQDLGLQADVYEVISYQSYNQGAPKPLWDFAELMRVSNEDARSFDIFSIDGQPMILLKGDFAISKFERMLSHYQDGPEKGSPFDAIFLAYGRKVRHARDIHISYIDVCRLLRRRFFLKENQHIVGFTELCDPEVVTPLPAKSVPEYAEKLADYIQSHNRTLIAESLRALRETLTASYEDIDKCRHFLIDIYIHTKQKLLLLYPNENIPFLANTAVIKLIEGKYYLYEILLFLQEQIELWIHTVGYASGESVLEEVVHYIQHNYQDNLRLESIAALFGYNSSYLGKIFHRKLGMNFNTYVDRVRIDKATGLLKEKRWKVYEVAQKTGYRDVDYFHKKFKKYTGTSPAEYRKQFGKDGDAEG